MRSGLESPPFPCTMMIISYMIKRQDVINRTESPLVALVNSRMGCRPGLLRSIRNRMERRTHRRMAVGLGG